jgi:multidrug efflux pump subunit AcrA (membrane-fusion protein)
MSLFIDLPVEEVRGIFVEPDTVFRRYGKNRVWIIDEDSSLRSREVITGSVVGSKIVIVSGLVTGERFLRAPTGNEKEGMALDDLFSRGASGGDG